MLIIIDLFSQQQAFSCTKEGKMMYNTVQKS